ncbi:hypothetical protein CU044_0201 [Streptomyces sp. L-9-10]|nr:hypothetical protein CU044_0201 [Streptomyces sp. L-9-10]
MCGLRRGLTRGSVGRSALRSRGHRRPSRVLGSDRLKLSPSGPADAGA